MFFVCDCVSSGVTLVHSLNAGAYKIFEVLKDEYGN